MSSRICVKNLPKHLTVERFRSHFESKGEVTDAKIMKTKDGRSRLFGFIGYKTVQEAKTAVSYFHNTFLDTSRIKVELAKSVGDDKLERPWSKYSKGSSANNSLLPPNEKTENKKKRNREEITEDPVSKKKKIEPTIIETVVVPENDPKFQTFVQIMQPSKQTNVWSNDTPIPKVQIMQSKIKSKRGGEDLLQTHVKFVESDEEYQDLPEKKDQKDKTQDDKDSIVNNPNVSDLYYLKTKMESGKEDDDIKEENAKKEDEKINNKEDNDDIGVTGRLFVRNLPFSVTEDDLINLFKPFGTLSEVHIPIDPITKIGKGFAYVLFVIPAHAVKAMISLDASIFQGRLIHILPAKSMGHNENKNDSNRSSYKQKQENARRKKSQQDHNWNSIFMSSDAVVESAAANLGVKKSEILDREADNMALRVLFAETSIIKETKEVLEKEGVCLDTLGAHQDKNITRSNTIILVKNIPFSTQSNELRALFSPFGEINRLVLPPAKTIALIEFNEPNEAKLAFRSLAYKKFKHLPLYLEWAPMGIFKTNAKSSSTQTSSEISSTKPENSVKNIIEEDIDIPEEEQTTSLYIKNLSFSTTEETLKEIFSSVGKLRSVTIAKKNDLKNPGKTLSMGFGFVEFWDKESAVKAMKTFQDHDIDDHKITLKFSQHKSEESKTNKRKSTKSGPQSTKLIIRNIPFEATKKEIREMAKPFGQVKAVRLPKKFDGTSRGFAFIEFTTKQEAANAFEALKHAHLYGRHLVIEHSADDSGRNILENN